MDNNSKNLTDAWNGDGNCNHCRRERYCTKRCRANKKLGKFLIERAIQRATFLTEKDGVTNGNV